MTRVGVAKTYKLYIGGAFPRSESGRTYPVTDVTGAFAANVAHGSRKDVRDAVAAARKAFGGWSRQTAYNRGQVIYRIAEMLEGRRAQFVELLRTAPPAPDAAGALDPVVAVDAAIDRLVHFAGWTDKLAAAFGSANPVAGPYFSFTTPEPTGVVGMVAPADPLLGLVDLIAPALAGGNTVVVVADAERPLPAVTLAEALATADLPGGVVNIVTGQAAELLPGLAAHADVNALDLTGVAGPEHHELRVAAERAAAQTVTRVFVPAAGRSPLAPPGTARLRAFLEYKTVWHPTGAVSLAGGGAY